MRQDAALRARRRRQGIIVAIAAVAIIALVGVALVVRSQLADRKQQIVAQALDTSYEVVPCEPSMLDIDLTRTGTIAGYPMTFGMTITNIGEQACSLDAGSKHLDLRVSSGSDLVWSSAHCTSGNDSRLYVFGPDVSSTITVEWSGARSDESCSGGLPSPQPGTYVVEGTVDGVTFPQLRDAFVLTNSAGIAPAPEEPEQVESDGEDIEPSPESEPDESSSGEDDFIAD